MFHKEGFHIITIAAMVLVLGIVLLDNFTDTYLLQKITQISLLLPFLGILYFYRNPKRRTVLSKKHIIAPIDGKIVQIQEIEESEYFHDKRVQITLSMSHLDVRVLRYPCSGLIKYSSYLKTKKDTLLVKKTSKEKEPTAVIIATEEFGDVLYRHIARISEKRIVNYASEGNQAIQGQDAGFIKFNSRIDLILPVNTQINVALGDQVKGGKHILGRR